MPGPTMANNVIKTGFDGCTENLGVGEADAAERALDITQVRAIEHAVRAVAARSARWPRADDASARVVLLL